MIHFPLFRFITSGMDPFYQRIRLLFLCFARLFMRFFSSFLRFAFQRQFSSSNICGSRFGFLRRFRGWWIIFWNLSQQKFFSFVVPLDGRLVFSSATRLAIIKFVLIRPYFWDIIEFSRFANCPGRCTSSGEEEEAVRCYYYFVIGHASRLTPTSHEWCRSSWLGCDDIVFWPQEFLGKGSHQGEGKIVLLFSLLGMVLDWLPRAVFSAFMAPSAVKHDPDKNIFLNTVCDDIVFWTQEFLGKVRIKEKAKLFC